MTRLNHTDERKDYLTLLVKKSEIKRIGENLTKSELTTIFDMHYNFYWNCVTKKNLPSKKLTKSLETYLLTPTHEVYEMVFAHRRKEERNKRISVDENGREIINESIEATNEEIEAFLKILEEEGIYKEPKASYNGS